MSSAPDVSWARSGAAGARARGPAARSARAADRPLTRHRIVGRQHLAGLDRPVLFVANHSSHIDTPTILRALPRAWRRGTAVAAAADYFYRVPWLAGVVSLAFNTVPMQRKGEAGGPDAASDLTRLIEAGWNLLVFAAYR